MVLCGGSSVAGVRVLVTGGVGFIGTAIVSALLRQGHEVVVLDARPVAGSGSGSGVVADPAGDGCRWIVGDIRDRGVVAEALRGVDAVSHQAAMVGLGVDLDDMPGYASCNDVGTAVLLAAMAAAGVRQLVLAGSMVVYGEGRYACDLHGDAPAPPRALADLRAGRFEPRCPDCGVDLVPGLITEEARPDPRNTYAVTKLAQEHLCRVWARETEGCLTVLRYHNVYGPGMPQDTPYAGVAAIFRSSLARGLPPRVFEDGGQRRDFVHVDDVAAANVTALQQGVGTESAAGQDGEARIAIYNVGSGQPRTVLDLAEALTEAVGGPRPVVTGQFRRGDVRHVTADSTRIRAELGWQPRVVFREGIAELASAAPAG
jgi:dTDP-L-rhamnose 4-epimerase